LRWIRTKIVEPSRYNGLTHIYFFINEFEMQILDQQILLALDIALKVTTTIWWDAHKDGIIDW
jgi:hypothetical protein